MSVAGTHARRTAQGFVRCMVDAALERARSLSCWAAGVRIVPTTEVEAELGLGTGRTNRNFVATAADGERFFVRIGVDLPPWGVTRRKEQAAAIAAAASGIGAAVHHAELPDALVCAFVDGRALTEQQVHAAASGADEQLLHALAAAVRTLHATPLPTELLQVAPPGPPRWAPPDLARWISYAREGGFSRVPLLEECDSVIARAEAFVEAGWPAEPPVFCHFDLLCDNFVVRDVPGGGGWRVFVVDFEYANAGQPLMDLAVLSMGCALSAGEERRLVASYLQKPRVDDHEAARFGALKMLACLRETFWGVVAEVSRASALSDEAAAAYVDEQYAKYVAARAEWEAWMRNGEGSQALRAS